MQVDQSDKHSSLMLNRAKNRSKVIKRLLLKVIIKRLEPTLNLVQCLLVSLGATLRCALTIILVTNKLAYYAMLFNIVKIFIVCARSDENWNYSNK
jgi:hypothetical protein